MTIRPLHAFLAATILVVAGGLGYRAVVDSQHQAVRACVGQSKSLIGSSDVPSLVSLGTAQTIVSMPFGMGRNAAIGSQFVIGLTEGFVSSAAVSGPYRQENDAYARSIGYTPGLWPLVPLTGSIVAEKAGILEAYETVLVFQDSSGVAAYLAAVRSSASNPYNIKVNGQAQDDHLSESNDGTILVASVEGPDDGLHEHAIGAYRAADEVVFQLSIRGGHITDTDALRLAGVAAQHLTEACNLTFFGGGIDQ